MKSLRAPLALAPLALAPLALAALAASPAARAQSLPPAGPLAAPPPAAAAVALPPVTVTATGIPTPVSTAPAGVTVLTPEQWQAKGATTLVQALQGLPGVDVVQSGGSDQIASVFLRGTDSRDVLVLQDGIPVNDPADPNGAFNFGTQSLTGIARIEVVRGPLSGLYGSNAIGGVINLITIKGAGKPQATVDLSGGFPAQGRVAGTISGSSGPFDYAFAGSLDSESGYDQTARRFSFYNGVKDPLRNVEGALNLGWRLAEDTHLGVILRGRQDQYRSSTAQSGFDDPDQRNKDNSLFGKLTLDQKLDNGALDLTLSAARLVDSRRYIQAQGSTDPADPEDVFGDSRYNSTRTDLRAILLARLADTGPFTGGTLRFLVSHDEDHASEKIGTTSLFTDPAAFAFPDSFFDSVRATQETLSGAIGAQATVAHQLLLSATVRDDAVSSFGDALTWRVGGTWSIPGTPLSIDAAYGTGFFAPSLFDLHGVDVLSSDGFNSVIFQGNPNLHPERSQGWEAGPTLTLPGHAGSITLKAFANDVRDLIADTPDFSSVENTPGVTHIRGLEASATLDPLPWLGLDASWTYENTNDLGLERRPAQFGSADLRLKPLPGLTIEPQVQVTGRFLDFTYANDFNATNFDEGEGFAEPGALVNLSVAYALSERLTLYATGRNLFESRFEPVNAFETEPQTFLFGVRAKFGG